MKKISIYIRRAFLPKTIYWRMVALIVVPVLMVQIFSLWTFYDRHWSTTTRSLASTLIRQLHAIIDVDKKSYDEGQKVARSLSISYSKKTPKQVPIIIIPSDQTGKIFIEQYLKNRKEYYPTIEFLEPRTVKITLTNEKWKYVFYVNEYQLYTTVTAKLVWYWSIFIGLIFILIALLTARNQALPIRNLARSLIAFSQGDNSVIEKTRVHGSSEVRTAIHNFKIMSRRISRQQQQRTDMLSGISHDLRTPLTRMKLLLAMLPKDKQHTNLSENIKDMEDMISAYLSFAKGEKDKVPELIHLHATLKNIAQKWQDAGHAVHFHAGEKISTKVRKTACLRMIENIISNAVHYGTQVDISLFRTGHYAGIRIIDNGCGVPEEKINDIFRPFVRLEESRNKKTGGIGLGLSVALDVAAAHGGTISVKNRQDETGLIVEIQLPISMDA